MADYTKRDTNGCFNDSRKRFEKLIKRLSYEKTLKLSHEQVEEIIDREGRDVLRQIYNI